MTPIIYLQSISSLYTCTIRSTNSILTITVFISILFFKNLFTTFVLSSLEMMNITVQKSLNNSPGSKQTLHCVLQYHSSLHSHNSCNSIQIGYLLETHHLEHQSCQAQTLEYCTLHPHTFPQFLS